MAATVFVFTGRAYYGKPGIDWHMAEVQEDYAESRPFKGSWAKAQSWMVANGYRKLWGTPAGRDGCDVTQVWGLVRVFGDTNVTYTGAYAVKAAFTHWQEAEREKEADVRFEQAYGRHTIYWFIDRAVDATEWMMSHGFHPAGYGPGQIKPASAYGAFINSGYSRIDVPAWAQYVVSHADNCD